MTRPDHDAIIIGAGMCGVYQLHALRSRGFDAILFEEGDDVGGTWYWNRYPGARFDSESYTYAYSFSEELLREWNWSERFAAQPEIHAYIRHVVDEFELRQHMRFEATVVAATWVEDDRLWRVELADGAVSTARLLLTALGVLSIPSMPRIDGLDDFAGPHFHTARWPGDLDLSGKRVAVIGTGSSGVQVIQSIAGEVGELFVFQRRPSWAAPLFNGPIDPAEMADIKANYAEIFDRCRQTPGAFIHMPDKRRVAELPTTERLDFWERLYAQPGFAILYANFLDVIVDQHANDLLSAFAAEKIRARVSDPTVADKLVPTDHGFGTRRLVLETNYYEAYNQDNVHLIDLLDTPIERVTEKSIVTTDDVYDVDVIILATGFDAVTGAYDRIDITGVNGEKLAHKWQDNPITYLGLQTHGFPNLFLLAGPQSGSGASNFPRGIEEQVNWTTDLIEYLRDQDADRVEASETAEQEWLAHVAERLSRTLLGRTRSWFTGYNTNIDNGDRPRLLLYMGGNVKYRQRLESVADEGYPGFDLTPARATETAFDTTG